MESVSRTQPGPGSFDNTRGWGQAPWGMGPEQLELELLERNVPGITEGHRGSPRRVGGGWGRANVSPIFWLNYHLVAENRMSLARWGG